jgi:sugar lactone lactonase YvrE
VILSTASVTTVAGSSSGNVNGIGTNSQFASPGGVTISANGVFALVADTNNYRIRRITLSTSSVTTLAGLGAGFADGTGTNSKFSVPSRVVISPDNLFAIVADTNNNRIRRITISTAVARQQALQMGSEPMPFSRHQLESISSKMPIALCLSSSLIGSIISFVRSISPQPPPPPSPA